MDTISQNRDDKVSREKTKLDKIWHPNIFPVMAQSQSTSEGYMVG